VSRPVTGRLIWTGAGYSARFGNRGKLIPLGTDDKRVALPKMAALARDPAALEAAGHTPPPDHETFTEAARRLVAVQVANGIPSAPARLSRIERWAIPHLGHLPVTKVRPGHVTALLEYVAGLGRSSTTLSHMRGDLIFVFGRLIKEETEGLTRNPARGELVDTPPGVDDERPRTILRDEEFVALVDAPTTPPQLRLMAIASRAVGGMRTSDLRAWQWSHLDTPAAGGTWGWADVPRPKTNRKPTGGAARRGATTHRLERLELPATVALELETWWKASGCPVDGPVFRMPPARKSYAADLRAALLAAGVDRHELHHDTERTRRVDFHSFRRAWATAIGAAGLNAQTAMLVTGHKQMSTHMRYQRPEAMAVPASAIPTWGCEK
jgi:integrase